VLFHGGELEVRQGTKDQGEQRAYRRAGQCNNDFLDWTFRDALQASQSPDGHESDVWGAYPEPAGSPRMPKFMKKNTAENHAQERHACNRFVPSPSQTITQPNPPQKQEQGDMHSYLDAREATYCK
jgi:hypothetical protein